MEMVRLSRLQLYGVVSTACFVWAIVNAFRVRSNFYSAAVYLSKSNACMMILWNQGIYQTVLFGKLVQKIFFGELRMIEVERLQERGWFAVTETLLALTIFKDDFESSFVMLFVSLLFLKVFHWLASDRVEMMEQTAQVSRLAHARMVGILSILWFADALLLIFAVESILLDGPTVMIMFASEYMILLATVWTITMKYVINCIDLRSEVPWENKSIWGLYVDLAADFFKLVTYVTFFSLILTFYGLPLNILRDVYITLRSFVLKCRDLSRYRAATRNMDTLYPNATLAEMEAMADKTCIICREDMEFRGERPPAADGADAGVAQGTPANADRAAAAPAPAAAAARPRAAAGSGPNDTPKKLPCGHVFHFHCLKSWLERQQSCPTCRRPVLPSEQPRNAPAPNAAAAAPAGRQGPPAAAGDAAIRQAHLNLARNLGREAFGVVLPDIPFPAEAERPAAAAAPGAQAPEGNTTPTSTPGPSATTPNAGESSTPSTTAGTNDNPLARFSLAEVPLPQTGEAGLYSLPSSPYASSSDYANIAYGLYPQQGNTRSGNAAVNARVNAARPTQTSTTSSSSTAPVTSTSTTAPNTSTLKQGPDKQELLSDDEPPMAGREAMLAAAERRRAAAGGSAASAMTPPAATVATASVSPATSTPSARVGISAAANATPRAQPHLIPLFDASQSGAYPALLASMPPPLVVPVTSTIAGLPAQPATMPSAPLFAPSSATNELSKDPVASEVDDLTRSGMELRLRTLLEWQGKIESMVGEMRSAIDNWPVGGRDGGEPAVRLEDKGKGKATEVLEALTGEDSGRIRTSPPPDTNEGDARSIDSQP